MNLITRNDDHEYYVNGIRVPGVNEILSAEGINPDFSKVPNIDYYRNLGTYVHNAIRMYFEGILDESSLTGPVKERFNGFLKYVSEHNFIPNFVEKRLYSKKWGYAGEPDTEGLDLGVSVMNDWKCSANVYPSYELSLPAYDLLIEENYGKSPEKHQLIQLLPNDFKVIPMEIKRQDWLAVLMTFKWKQKRRLYGTR